LGQQSVKLKDSMIIFKYFQSKPTSYSKLKHHSQPKSNPNRPESKS